MIYNETPPNTLSTTDLYLCAFLKVVGCRIIRVDRNNGKKVRFIFSESAEAKILDFHNGAKVDACRYASAVEEIKGLIFDVK